MLLVQISSLFMENQNDGEFLFCKSSGYIKVTGFQNLKRYSYFDCLDSGPVEALTNLCDAEIVAK